jgi:hypothetical protein
MAERQKKLIQRAGILRFILYSLVLVIAAAGLLMLFLDLTPHDPLKFFDAKLTFFSIIFAAALIQYQYFSQEYIAFYTDFVPGWDQLDIDVTKLPGDQQLVEKMEEIGRLVRLRHEEN